MIWYDVDTALAEVPVNAVPLTDDGDSKSLETTVAYNASGMALYWHFITPAGAYTVTQVTPTTGGTYDWAHQQQAMYTIEIPASGGASINNDTEGWGYFTGVATGVLPWRGPTIGFRAAALNDALVEGGDLLDVSVTQFGGTNGTFAGGRPEVNTSHWGGTAVGSATPNVNVTQISGDSAAADNAEAFFDGTGYAGTNNVIPTVTNLTNAPAIPQLPATLQAICTGFGLAGQGLYDATSSGNRVTATGLQVARWEDLLGGAAFTQSTSADRPRYDADRNLVVFEEGYTEFMTRVLAGNRNSFAAYIVSEVEPLRRPWSLAATNFSGFSGHSYLLSADAVAILTRMGSDAGTNPGRMQIFAGGFNTSSLYVPSSMSLVGLSGNGSNLFIHSNETTQSVGSNSSSAFSNIYLGNSTATTGLQAGVKAWFTFSRKLTDAEHAELWQFAKTLGAVDLSLPLAVGIADGDSMTSALTASLNGGWYNRVMRTHANIARYNLAEAKAHIDNLDTYGSRVDNVLNPRVPCHLFAWMGTNNIASSQSGATVYGKYVAYCNDRRAAMKSGDTITIATALSRGGSIPGRADFNNLLRADFSTPTPWPYIYAANPGVTYADYMVDLAAHTLLSDHTNRTYFSADTVHLVDLGHKLVASIWQPLADHLFAENGQFTRGDRGVLAGVKTTIGTAGDGLTTLAPAADTTALLNRLTANRAGWLDFLNVGGNVATSGNVAEVYDRIGEPAGETISEDIASISVGSNPNVLLTAEIATVNSQTSFTLASGADFNDAYNGQTVVLYDNSNSDFPSVRVVNDYVGSTKTVTIDSAPAFTLAADDSVAIFATAPGTTAPTVTQIREELDNNSTKLANLDATMSSRATNAGAASAVSAATPPEEFFENAPIGGGPGAADTRDLKPVQHTWQLKRSGVGTLQSTNPYYVSPGDGSAGGLRVGWNCDIPSVLPPGSVIETQTDPPVLVTPSDDITITHIGHDDKIAKVQIEIAADAEPGSHWIKTEITNDDGGGPIAVYGEVVIQAEPE